MFHLWSRPWQTPRPMRTSTLVFLLSWLSGCGGNFTLTVAAERPTAVADGLDAVRVVARVQDASGPRSAITVHFSAPSPARLSVESVLTDARGEATTQVVSTADGLVQISAALVGLEAPGPAQVTFGSLRLRFATSPTTTSLGNLLRPAPVVTIEAPGSQPTQSTATVSLRVTPGSCAATLDDSSLSAVAAQNGSATFFGLKLGAVGSGCTLSASAPGVVDAVSAAFDVVP